MSLGNDLLNQTSTSVELKIDLLESEVKKERGEKHKLVSDLKQDFAWKQEEMHAELQLQK